MGALNGGPDCSTFCWSCIWKRRVIAAAALLLFAHSPAAFGQASGNPASREPVSGAAAAQSGETTPSGKALSEANSFLQRGMLSHAETATRKFLEQHPDSADGHFLLGYILFDELHEKYVGEERKEGDSFRYNENVGGELAKMRDAKARESLAEFSAGARYRAASAFDLKIVALDYVLLKDNPSADKWLTVSLRLNPKDAQGWFYLGRTKYSETEYPAAIEAFEQCLKLEPRNILAEYNVGLSYEGLNQKDEAIQAYQNAIEWQAQSEIKSPEPFVYLARLYMNQNQPERAVPYLVQAVAAFPQVSLAHEELGRAYSVLHRLPEAQDELEKAVKLSPEKASLRCVLGQVYQRQGMTAKAQTEFDRCSALQNTQSSHPTGTEQQ